MLKQDIGILMGMDWAPFWEICFVIFLNLSMFKILFLKYQLELVNIMLLIDSWMTFAQ